MPLTWIQHDYNSHVPVKGCLAAHQHTSPPQELITASYLIIKLYVDWLFSALKMYTFQINFSGRRSLLNFSGWLQLVSLPPQFPLCGAGGERRLSDCRASWQLLSRCLLKSNRTICWITVRTKLILTQLASWLLPHAVCQSQKIARKN